MLTTPKEYSYTYYTPETTAPASAPSSLASQYVSVETFGAVGDYNTSTGIGTDDTVAIQATIDSTKIGGVNFGRVVLLASKHYKTTAPLIIYESTSMMSTSLVRAGAWIEFCGGPTDDAIQAIGTTTKALSRCALERFTVQDRRVSPTSGDGVYLERVFNNVFIRNMDIRGFPTGSSIRVSDATGGTSDCITVDDIWSLGSQYGINIDNVDNITLVRDIKIDSSSTSPLIAGIRVSGINGVVFITGVKHENTKATAPTIQLDTFITTTVIDGITSRIGGGGPVVSLLNTTGAGVTIRSLNRQFSGVLLETTGSPQNKTVTGTTLPFWLGGADGLQINSARLYGTTAAGQDADIFIGGRLNTDPVKGLISLGPQTTSRTAVANANYFAAATDYLVAVTSLTAPRTVTLPAATAGRKLTVKDESGAAGAFAITVAGGGVRTIDGAASIAINVNYGSVQLYSNGTNWFTT